jgi:hypothetical protein
MTSQGTAHGRFQRAIRARDLWHASMAARELGTVSLGDALALTLLTAEVGDDRWPRAAARWLGRFIIESPPAITIGEAGLAAAAIQELAGDGGRGVAAETLRQLASTRGPRNNCGTSRIAAVSAEQVAPALALRAETDHGSPVARETTASRRPNDSGSAPHGTGLTPQGAPPRRSVEPFVAVRRRASPPPQRPVTPEVAGSSPVAPVLYLRLRVRVQSRRAA